MKVIHLNGFTTEERAAYRTAVHNNAISCIRAIARAAEDFGYQIKEKVCARVRVWETVEESFIHSIFLKYNSIGNWILLLFHSNHPTILFFMTIV